MIRIEIEPLEQKDLIEILNYASEMKELNRPPKPKNDNKWDDTDYWLSRITHLKRLIEGKIIRDDIYRSSLGTIQTDGKYHYGEELLDVFDSEKESKKHI